MQIIWPYFIINVKNIIKDFERKICLNISWYSLSTTLLLIDILECFASYVHSITKPSKSDMIYIISFYLKVRLLWHCWSSSRQDISDVCPFVWRKKWITKHFCAPNLFFLIVQLPKNGSIFITRCMKLFVPDYIWVYQSRSIHLMRLEVIRT